LTADARLWFSDLVQFIVTIPRHYCVMKPTDAPGDVHRWADRSL